MIKTGIRITFITLGGILVLLGSIAFFTKPTEVKPKTSPIAESTTPPTANPSATPMPFEELTIPYLRNRTYSSKLGELTKVQENTSYTGYITRYTSDSLKINSLLTIPKGEKPQAGWPAVVFIHGYIPPKQYQTLEKYVEYVDYLAKNGFVVFKIDLRGHGSSEGQAGGGYYGSDYVVDTLSAYKALQSADFVNPNGIGLWGHSMAGNTILRSMAAQPDIPASVIWAGAVYTYTDMQKYGIQDSSYQPLPSDNERRKRQQKLFAQYGRPAEGNPFWNLVAATNYLEDLKGAIQIHHAENDATVKIGYSNDLIALLDKTNVPHELFTYPSGGHNINGPSFSVAMQRTVEFFKRYLTS